MLSVLPRYALSKWIFSNLHRAFIRPHSGDGWTLFFHFRASRKNNNDYMISSLGRLTMHRKRVGTPGSCFRPVWPRIPLSSSTRMQPCGWCAGSARSPPRCTHGNQWHFSPVHCSWLLLSRASHRWWLHYFTSFDSPDYNILYIFSCSFSLSLRKNTYTNRTIPGADPAPRLLSFVICKS